MKKIIYISVVIVLILTIGILSVMVFSRDDVSQPYYQPQIETKKEIRTEEECHTLENVREKIESNEVEGGYCLQTMKSIDSQYEKCEFNNFRSLNEEEKQYFDYSKNGDYNYMVSCTCCYDYIVE